VLAAADAAAELGLVTWALTGPPGNPLAARADDCLTVDSPHTATVQEIHLIAIHLLCARVDERAGAHGLPPGGDRVSALVVIGDALLDRDLDGPRRAPAPDAPVPWSTGWSATTARAAPGSPRAGRGRRPRRDARLRARRRRGRRRVRELLDGAGVRVCDLGPAGRDAREGARARGRPRAGAAGRGGEARELRPAHRERRAALGRRTPCSSRTTGRGVAAEPTVRAALARLAGTPIVWDPHPNGAGPVAGCTLVTPERGEAERAAPARREPRAAARDARAATRPARAPCAGAGAPSTSASRWARAGRVLAARAAPRSPLPAPPGRRRRPLRRRATASPRPPPAGWPRALPSEAVRAAVAAASAFVAAGGAAGWVRARGRPRAAARGRARARRRRARRRAAPWSRPGGCFDLLHAGHVRALEAAPALGDCLIVCLNSDASVRRLKGPTPARGPSATAPPCSPRCAASTPSIVFDEDDPRAVLRELRPHVWAKGGDYAVAISPSGDARRVGRAAR
jgi:cytidyltransferase-like protein